MSLEAILDNDILIKCACFDVLDETSRATGGPSFIGILGVAKFVVRRHIWRSPGLGDRDAAIGRFECFLADVDELEPDLDELELAATFEESALRKGAELDTGESLLCAIAIARGVPRLMTGDKRAIRSIEHLAGAVTRADSVRGRIVCLEQLVLHLGRRIGFDVLRGGVCAEPRVDRALSACFSCFGGEPNKESYVGGLQSYIKDLRTAAPTVLASDDEVFP